MSRWLCTLVLALSLPCFGQSLRPEDDTNRVTAEKGFFDRLGQSVMDRASNVRDRASHLVFNAMHFMGVPYKRGGNDADTGFDCSGFVRAMYEQTLGLALPRRASEQAAATQKIDRKDLKPGDLVFFNTMRRAFSHVGIYVGEGKFIHAPKPGAQVRVESMGGSYWARRFDGARRVITGAPAPEAVAVAPTTPANLPLPEPMQVQAAPQQPPLLP